MPASSQTRQIDSSGFFPLGLYGIWIDIENDLPHINQTQPQEYWENEIANFSGINANYMVDFIPLHIEDTLLYKVAPLGYRIDIQRSEFTGRWFWDSDTTTLRKRCKVFPANDDTTNSSWIVWRDTTDFRLSAFLHLYGNNPNVLTFNLGGEVDVYHFDDGLNDYRRLAYKYVCEQFNVRYPDPSKKLYVYAGTLGLTQQDDWISGFVDVVPVRMWVAPTGYHFSPIVAPGTPITYTIQQLELDSIANKLDFYREIFKYRPIEMWVIMQAHKAEYPQEYQQFRNRYPDEHELRAEAYLSLSRGAKGFNWYVYGSASWGETRISGLVNRARDPVRDQFGYIAGVNSEIGELGPIMRKLFVRDGITSEQTSSTNSAGIRRIYGDRVEAGTFKKFYRGDSTDYVMLVNRRMNDNYGELTDDQVVYMTVDGGRFFTRDARTGMVSFGTWYPAGDSTSFADTLAPGSGSLFHLKRTLEGVQDEDRQLHELEIVTGTYTIDSGVTVTAKPGTTVVFQPGTQMVLRRGGLLLIDSGAVLDLGNCTLICEGDSGVQVIVREAGGICGSGEISGGRIEWQRGWTVDAGDSLCFTGGAFLDFACDSLPGTETVAHIYGIVYFAPSENPYRFGACLDTILVGAWDGSLASRMETGGGVVLQHVPYIHCVPGALLLSKGSSEAVCRWLFRLAAGCLATGHIEADFTEFARSDFDEPGSAGWSGITVAYDSSRVRLDECLVRHIFTTPAQGGYALHLYESPNPENSVKRTRFLRMADEGDHGQGIGVFLQYGQGYSYLDVECCEIGDSWLSGLTETCSESHLLRNTIEGNLIGMEAFHYSVARLEENRIRNSRVADVGFLTGVGISAWSFSAVHLGDQTGQEPGRNIIRNHELRQVTLNMNCTLYAGNNDPNNWNVFGGRNQIVSETGAWRLWLDTLSYANACWNWYGAAPDSTDGIRCLYSAQMADTLFYAGPWVYWFPYHYNPVMCDTASTTSGACEMQSRALFDAPSFGKQASFVPIAAASSVGDFPVLARAGNFAEIYRFLGIMFQSSHVAPGRFLAAAGALMQLETEHLRSNPDSATLILSRASGFLNARYAQSSGASLRAGLLYQLAGLYSAAGDCANSDAAIAELATLYPASIFAREAPLIGVVNALSRSDTSSCNLAMSEMQVKGSSADARRLAGELKHGHLRVPRRSTIPALAKNVSRRAAGRPGQTIPGSVSGVVVTHNPEPFSGRTVIRYRLPESTKLRLAVYSPLGKEVAVPAAGHREAGEHEAVFEASHALPSGVYYYVLTTDKDRASGMLRLVR